MQREKAKPGHSWDAPQMFLAIQEALHQWITSQNMATRYIPAGWVS